MNRNWKYRTLLRLAVVVALASVDAGRLHAQNDVLMWETVTRLRHENDSLRKQLQVLRNANSVETTWDNLEGVSDEVDFSFYFEDYPAKGTVGNLSEIQSARSSDPMTEAEIRIACPSSSVRYSSDIRKYLNLYTGRREAQMRRVLYRYHSWEGVFKAAFDRRGVPEDLMSLVIVESAVSTRALSPAGAYGMWQIMPGTARTLGLRVDALVDERLDVWKASEAAARHLASSYKEFGSWDLAVLAYNCGNGNVRKAIAQAGGGTPVEKVMLYLPDETRAYLPSMIAARYALVYHEQLGWDIPKSRDVQAVRVTCPVSTSIQKLAETIEADPGQLAEMNPQFLIGIIPEGSTLSLTSKQARLFNKSFSGNKR